MINETVQAILKAEADADAMIKQAMEDAKNMAVNADAECEKIRTSTKNAVKEERKKTVELAAKEGEAQYAQILAAGKRTAEKLKQNTDKNGAVDFIKEKVLLNYGSC